MSHKENIDDKSDLIMFIEFIEKQNPDKISTKNWRKIIWDIQEKNDDLSIHLEDKEKEEKVSKFDNLL